MCEIAYVGESRGRSSCTHVRAGVSVTCDSHGLGEAGIGRLVSGTSPLKPAKKQRVTFTMSRQSGVRRLALATSASGLAFSARVGMPLSTCGRHARATAVPGSTRIRALSLRSRLHALRSHVVHRWCWRGLPPPPHSPRGHVTCLMFVDLAGALLVKPTTSFTCVGRCLSD